MLSPYDHKLATATENTLWQFFFVAHFDAIFVCSCFLFAFSFGCRSSFGRRVHRIVFIV